MAYTGTTPAQRTVSALAATGVVLLIGMLMVWGLQVRFGDVVVTTLTAFTSKQTPPPAVEETPRPRPSSAAKNAPSPRNLRNRATPVLAAPSPLPVSPPPIVAAPAPAEGTAAQSGAAEQPGPGQGAGGAGSGTGGGGQGGTGNGIATGPRQIRGKLSSRDFDYGLILPGQRASVEVRYVVEIDGRVSTCRIDASSGLGEVDAMACRLIVERFRFRPARDRSGRPVRSTVIERHTWFSRTED